MWFPELADRVRNLSPEGFWFILVVLIVVSCLAFYFIWRSLHRARVIEDMPTARLRSAHQGYVELEGVGQLLEGPPIIAPLTGIHCLWYSYSIEQRQTRHDSRGRANNYWQTIDSGVSDALFMLDDGTGQCIIDPEGAEVIAEVQDVWYGREAFPKRGPSTTGGWLRGGSGDYRYREARLMPGTLYALGWFNTVRNAPGSVDAEVGALLRKWKLDQAGLLARFDRNGDGQIDAGEWDQARMAALQEVIAQQAQRPATPDSHVLARSPSDRQPFLLSALPQAALVRRYRRRSFAALIGTFGGLAITLWYIAARFWTAAG